MKGMLRNDDGFKKKRGKIKDGKNQQRELGELETFVSDSLSNLKLTPRVK